MNDYCGNSSVGRASRCQRECREFESRFPLQMNILGSKQAGSGSGPGQFCGCSSTPSTDSGFSFYIRYSSGWVAEW